MVTSCWAQRHCPHKVHLDENVRDLGGGSCDALGWYWIAKCVEPHIRRILGCGFYENYLESQLWLHQPFWGITQMWVVLFFWWLQKIWESVIEYRLSHETTISKNQFGFMPTIFLHKHLKERYREVSKDPHIGFIDLEKSYDRLFEEFMWWFLRGKKSYFYVY